MPKLSKESALKLLSDVPESNRFWCNDGKVLNNLFELEEALEIMSEDTFNYHANDNRNDFVNWVKDLYQDEKLVKDLSKAKTKATALKRVKARIDVASKLIL